MKIRKAILNISIISLAYQEGKTVNVETLDAKKKVAQNVKYLKVLARGTPDKN